MDRSYTTVLIILCAVVITTTAAPTSEEVVESYGDYGELIEGDMLLSKEQQDALYNTGVDTRNGVRSPAKRWPNDTVLYHFEENAFDENELKVIEGAFAEIAGNSCVKFRKREKNSTEHAVSVQSSKPGCYSNIGPSSPNDPQVLNLGKGCVYHGAVVHETLHTLAFFHMQSTYDRDDYVTIVWENIEPGHESNFNKYNKDLVTNFGVPYDYTSVMHYASDAFSRNGSDTIVSKQANETIRPSDGLSEKDILKLNRMYNCSETSTTKDDY